MRKAFSSSQFFTSYCDAEEEPKDLEIRFRSFANYFGPEELKDVNVRTCESVIIRKSVINHYWIRKYSDMENEIVGKILRLLYLVEEPKIMPFILSEAAQKAKSR